MNDVHTLLERAAEAAGPPAVSTEAVYAGAARVRFRRRATMSMVTLAVVAAGAVALPGFADEPRPEQTSVAAAPVGQDDTSGKAGRLAALLPDEVGSLSYKFHGVLFIFGPMQSGERRVLYSPKDGGGPLDGVYDVDEGRGTISLNVLDREFVAEKLGPGYFGPDACKEHEEEAPVNRNCVVEELPGGEKLVTWDTPAPPEKAGALRFGPVTAGRLLLKDGTALLAQAGYTGTEPGKSPLSRSQLRELIQRPELRTGR